MFNPLHIIFGTKYDRDLKKLKPLVEVINSLEEKMKQMKKGEPRRGVTNMPNERIIK